MEQKKRSNRRFNIARIKDWTGLIRDVGVILGIPVLFVVGMKLYDKQIDALKAENEALKAQMKIYELRQYDKAFSLIDGQKKTFEEERRIFEREQKSLMERISILSLQGEQKNDDIYQLKISLETVNTSLKNIQLKIEKLKYLTDSGSDLDKIQNYIYSNFVFDISGGKIGHNLMIPIFSDTLDYPEFSRIIELIGKQDYELSRKSKELEYWINKHHELERRFNGLKK
jgi:hypothetical protein